MTTNENYNLLELTTRAYQDYDALSARRPDCPWPSAQSNRGNPPPHRRNENKFCALMATRAAPVPHVCKCRRNWRNNAPRNRNFECELGLCDTAVPVKLGEN